MLIVTLNCTKVLPSCLAVNCSTLLPLIVADFCLIIIPTTFPDIINSTVSDAYDSVTSHEHYLSKAGFSELGTPVSTIQICPLKKEDIPNLFSSVHYQQDIHVF